MPPKCYGAYSSSVSLHTFLIVLTNKKVTFKPSLLRAHYSEVIIKEIGSLRQKKTLTEVCL